MSALCYRFEETNALCYVMRDSQLERLRVVLLLVLLGRLLHQLDRLLQRLPRHGGDGEPATGDRAGEQGDVCRKRQKGFTKLDNMTNQQSKYVQDNDKGLPEIKQGHSHTVGDSDSIESTIGTFSKISLIVNQSWI